MKTITERQLQENTVTEIDAAQDCDITIEREGEPVAVLISYEEYQCYEELAEEMNMLEYLVAEVEEKEKSGKISAEVEKVGDKEIKEFLHIQR